MVLPENEGTGGLIKKLLVWVDGLGVHIPHIYMNRLPNNRLQGLTGVSTCILLCYSMYNIPVNYTSTNFMTL